MRTHISRFILVTCVLLAPAQTRGEMPPFPLVPLPCVPPGFVPEPCDPPVPIVRLRLRTPACGEPGQNLRYRIQVDNCSPAPAHHVVVCNTLPPNAKVAFADPAPELEGNDLVWRIGMLCGGCCKEILLVLTPLDACDVKNCARVQFEHGQCVTTHMTAAPQLPPGAQPPMPKVPVGPPGVRPVPKDQIPSPPPKAPELPTPLKRAALTLKIAGPKQQNVDLLTVYTLTVTNPGTGPATKLLVTADVPQQMQFDSASDDGRFYQGRVAWVADVLPAGETRTLTLKVRARAEGELCILAEAIANDGGTGKELGKVHDQACTLFRGETGLHIEMIDRTDPIEVGGATSYPIRVRNQGLVQAANVRIQAFIPQGMVFDKATGPTNYRLQAQPTPDGFQVVDFDPLPSLAAQQEILYEVFVQARREGISVFRVQMTGDPLPAGTVTENESTTVFRDDVQPRPVAGEL